MRGYTKSISIRGKDLDREAVLAANRELLKTNPQLLTYSSGRGKIRKLTMDRSDYLYRKEWLDAYYNYLNAKTKKSIKVIQVNRWDCVIIGISIRWWSHPRAFLYKDAIKELESCISVVETGVNHHIRLRKGHWFTGFFSELFGGVDINHIAALTKLAKGDLNICRQAYNQPTTEDHHIEIGLKHIVEAARMINKIDKELNNYRKAVIGGAQTSITGIEIIITVLSTMAGAGAVGLAGKGLSRYRSFTVAAQWLEKKPVLQFFTTTATEFAAKTTFDTGASLITKVRTGQKIDWGKLGIKVMEDFAKDVVSGGLSKIFIGKMTARLNKKWPNLSRLIDELELEPLKIKSHQEFTIKLLNSMGVESFYQVVVVRAKMKNDGKIMSLDNFLEEMTKEFAKFISTEGLTKLREVVIRKIR